MYDCGRSLDQHGYYTLLPSLAVCDDKPSLLSKQINMADRGRGRGGYGGRGEYGGEYVVLDVETLNSHVDQDVCARVLPTCDIII